MNLFDTHCHLEDAPLDTNVKDILAAARAVGVTRFLVPSVGLPTSRKALGLAEVHAGVQAAVGWHPAFLDGGVDLAALEMMVENGSVAAIGEIGLDRIKHETDIAVQEQAFALQLAFAATKGLPVVIHCRNAFARALQLIEDLHGRHPHGVFHAYAGSWEMAKRLADLGFFFGVGGSITWEQATHLRDIISRLPLNRLLLETDAPYIGTASTKRGTVTPAHLPEVASALAVLHGLPVETIAQVTTANASVLFGVRPSGGVG